MQTNQLMTKITASLLWLGLFFTGSALAQQSNTLLGVNCAAPPVYHCPDSDCPSAVVTQPGDTVELKTRRTFFLDCPADYQPGDKVSILMSLHGFGSYANWQRNYFPVMDVKDQHKLVVITPGSPTRFWSEADDGYLHNIVDLVVGAVGKENVEHFILAGHSQGGLTSSRLVCTDYFKDKVDVRISLSGGRVGETIPANRGFADGGLPVWRSGEADAPPAPRTTPAFPAASGPPGGPCDYSFIFAVGEYEQTPTATSPLADKYGCDARIELPEVLDPKKGYVWDATRQDPGTDGWGRVPRSGRAQVFQFPNCQDGRVVADVVKLRKGHTEGYEPNVTEKIVELALSARGGKIANGSWTPPAPPAPLRGPFGN
ncbi:MAG: alpha/beta hydrolase [Pseudomonadales bacterium]|nr:alpha/beta hydrolase [Pseudomonadales bacterium]